MRIIEEAPHRCSEDIGDPALTPHGTLVECACGLRYRAKHRIFHDSWVSQ